MVTAEMRQRRRGSRRPGAVGVPSTAPGSQPGLVERVLSFEAYTGFPHQEIGILVGLLHAVDLWVRRGGKPGHGGSGGVPQP